MRTSISTVGALAALANNVESPPTTPHIVQAHIVFRHGARTPVFWNDKLGVDIQAFQGKCAQVNTPPGISGSHVIPSAFRSAHLDLRDLDGTSGRPFSPIDANQLRPVYGDCRVGQLTDLGAAQSAALGRTLHERYHALAVEARRANKLFLRSTNIARCVATMQFVLGEVFPEDRAVFLGLTASPKEESLYPNPTHCPLLADQMESAKLVWESGTEHDEVVEAVRHALPKDAFAELRIEGANFVRIRDYLVAYAAHDLPQPWTQLDAHVADQIHALGTLQIFSILKSTAKASVGALLGIFDQFMREDGVRLSLVAAHDTTLIPILAAMELTNDVVWPDFCSWVAFEHWSDGRVEVVFNGTTRRVFKTSAEFHAILAPLLHPTQESWKSYCHSIASSHKGEVW